MNIKIKSVNDDKLDEYKSALDKYNAVYSKNKKEYVGYGESEEDIHHAIIEVECLEDLFSLVRDIGVALIINNCDENELEIYDDYIE